jgi:hypothetical protein
MTFKSDGLISTLQAKIDAVERATLRCRARPEATQQLAQVKTIEAR